ncbi:sodium:proton antiporter [Halalkalibacillus sediminis]|uniref:Sodium:proton antiporter n=1 Tax=Halalkalibacillus sediminis TaxID=2018042 RepID=A0A2I0QUR4_9BACI|nr:Na+/H+ antiporter NhaC family protein [Halalkalibacillus sediminis]PKR78091.1 sodium:proton antiporter [Halalkalibacillus sediminis]
MEGTIWSLVPPLVVIILVLLTRKVLLSLGAGIVVGALMIAEFDVIEALNQIWSSFIGNFYVDGAIETWGVQLILFLLLLGVLIAFLTATGGARAFGRWAIERIQTREGSQYTTGLLGLGIFIDDYFNSLTIGQVSRPITDRQNVSRAKLAYLIDSTSAPVTVLMPISSWGAYIIGTIGVIIADHELGYQAFETFVRMIPFNFYAIAAIILVFVVIRLNLDIGLMRQHEKRAKSTGELIDPLNKGDIPGDLKDDVHESERGYIYHLVAPILILIGATVITMVVTGIDATEGDVSLVSIFANTNVNYSLCLGGAIAVVSSMALYFMQKGEKTNFFRVVWEGIKAMLPAIYILVLAWMTVSIIGGIGTDAYLAQKVEEDWNFTITYLPIIVFMISGFMAFATGTSWGTFGIMLPIAGSIAASMDPNFFVPALAAVLAGSVFGDHCSPISDTTVLSSTGAGSNHIDHVMTQIPYAIIAAVSSLAGYLLYGLTGSLIVGLLVTIGFMFLIVYFVHRKVREVQ